MIGSRNLRGVEFVEATHYAVGGHDERDTTTDQFEAQILETIIGRDEDTPIASLRKGIHLEDPIGAFFAALEITDEAGEVPMKTGVRTCDLGELGPYAFTVVLSVDSAHTILLKDRGASLLADPVDPQTWMTRLLVAM